MAVVDIAPEELGVGIVMQSTWGSRELDSVNYNQANNGALLTVESANWDPDIQVRDIPRALASRRMTMDAIVHDTSGAAPKITVSGPVRANDIDISLALFFQTVTESGTYYLKEFTQADSQPADFTNGAGYFATMILKHPSTAKSIKGGDMICSDLKFSLEPGGMLMYEATFVGRSALTYTSSPTGTWAGSPADTFLFYDLARYQFSSADYICGGFEISFHQEVIPIGHTGTGDFQTFAIGGAEYTYSMTFIDNGGLMSTFQTPAAAGTEIGFEIGWGNATPGTTENDFEFTWTGSVDSAQFNHETPEGITVTGTMADTDGSQSPVSVKIANAVNRGW